MQNYLRGLWVALLFLVASGAKAGEFEVGFRKEVAVFLERLDGEQAERCLFPLDEKREGGRWQMRYTGGQRLGLKLGDLSEKQREAFDRVIQRVLSEHGWKMAENVMAQDGVKAWKNYRVACFGDPRKEGADFAFRFAEHHLTVVQLEVAEGTVKEFGPVLLGANPPELWLEEEQDVMALWKAINPAQQKQILKVGKKATASKPLKKGEGVLLRELNPEAAVAAQVEAMMARRMSVFTEPVRKRLKKLVEKRTEGEEGESLVRLSFYGEPPLKSCREGGRWDFKMGTEKFNLDLENSRGHLHLSFWVKE